MDWFGGVILGFLLACYFVGSVLISPTALSVRLYELGYSTGEQQAIMSGLTYKK